MPSWEIFEEQSEEYKESVLPKNVRARVAVKPDLPLDGTKAGLDGEVISRDDFGASAADILFKNLGLQ